MIAEQFRQDLSGILAGFKALRDSTTVGMFGGGGSNKAFIDFYDSLVKIGSSKENNIGILLKEVTGATRKFIVARPDKKFSGFSEAVNGLLARADYNVYELLISFAAQVDAAFAVKASAVEQAATAQEGIDRVEGKLAKRKRTLGEVREDALKAKEEARQAELLNTTLAGDKMRLEGEVGREKGDKERFERKAKRYRAEKEEQATKLNETMQLFQDRDRRLNETMAALERSRMDCSRWMEQSRTNRTLDRTTNGRGTTAWMLEEVMVEDDFQMGGDPRGPQPAPAPAPASAFLHATPSAAAAACSFSHNPNTTHESRRVAATRQRRQYTLDDLKFYWSPARIQMLQVLNGWYKDHSNQDHALLQMIQSLYKEEATPRNIMTRLQSDQHGIQSGDVRSGVLARCSQLENLDALDLLLWVNDGERGITFEDLKDDRILQQFKNKASTLFNLVANRSGISLPCDEEYSRYLLKEVIEVVKDKIEKGKTNSKLVL